MRICNILTKYDIFIKTTFKYKIENLRLIRDKLRLSNKYTIDII